MAANRLRAGLIVADQLLGVPLHAEHEPLVAGHLHTLDDAVGRPRDLA